MYLLDKLATHGLDYFHFSMGSWARNSIVDPEDKEPLITKYRQLQSETVSKVPVIGVGGIAQRADAEKALSQGYDLVSVGKGYLVEPTWAAKALNDEPCAEFADIAQQVELQIPTPLWEIIVITSYSIHYTKLYET